MKPAFSPKIAKDLCEALGLPIDMARQVRVKVGVDHIAEVEVDAFATEDGIEALKAALQEWSDARQIMVIVNVEEYARDYELSEGG